MKQKQGWGEAGRVWLELGLRSTPVEGVGVVQRLEVAVIRMASRERPWSMAMVRSRRGWPR
jgi:hypothetical protein